MGGRESCKRIVSTKPGHRTGETVYVTEDGRRWTSEVSRPINGLTGGTGVAYGYVHGDRMCDHP